VKLCSQINEANVRRNSVRSCKHMLTKTILLAVNSG